MKIEHYFENYCIIYKRNCKAKDISKLFLCIPVFKKIDNILQCDSACPETLWTEMCQIFVSINA